MRAPLTMQVLRPTMQVLRPTTQVLRQMTQVRPPMQEPPPTSGNCWSWNRRRSVRVRRR
jgi:hypothetical protein